MTSDTQLHCDSTECPYCKMPLSYESGGKVYSKLIGVYSHEQDKTIGWRCPNCGKEDLR